MKKGVVVYLSILGLISLLFLISFVSSAEFNVKDYGAKGDGKTDDTLAIQKALDDAGKNPGSKVIVPAGTYMVDAVKRLYIRSYTHLSLDKSATLKAIANDKDSYFILYINKSEEGFIRISGGTLEGDKGSHKGDLPEGGGSGMGIGMYGRKNIIIENMSIINAFGDGIYFGEGIGATNENILVRNVKIKNTGRNTVSIKTAKNFFVDNLVSEDTYLYSVDFEPNKEVLEKGSLYLDNIVMKKLKLNKKMTILGRDEEFSFYISDSAPSSIDFRCKEEYRTIYNAYGIVVYNGVVKECYCGEEVCPPKTPSCNLDYKCDAGENEQNCYFDCVPESLWTSPPASTPPAVSVPAQTPATYNVKDYGAKGDGKTDDSVAIQNLLNNISKPGVISKVIVPAGTYMINTTKKLKVRNNTEIILDKNAVLQAIPSDDSHYKIFYIINSENVTIHGGTLLGDRDKHKGSEGEWGHCISIAGSKNVLIYDMDIKNAFGDGIWIGPYNITPSKDVVIRNVNIDNSRRNGISIISAINVLISNSKITRSNGVAPKCGIDLEPEHFKDYYLTNIIISNITFKDNGENLKVFAKVVDSSIFFYHKAGMSFVYHCKDEYPSCGTFVYNNELKKKCNCDGVTTFRTVPVCDLDEVCDAGENVQNCFFDCKPSMAVPVIIPAVSVPNHCSSIIYSDWGACVGGVQTRSELSRSPSGCINASTLSRTCSVPCDYLNWQSIDSECSPVSSTFIRNWSRIGECNISTGMNKPEFEIISCIPNSLVSFCTIFNYSNWSECSQNGLQNRSVLSSLPNNCSGGNPLLVQSCVPSCTDSDWIAKDSECTASNSFIRTWIKIRNCNENSGVKKVSAEILTCENPYVFPICTNFSYSPWSTCFDGTQKRAVLSAEPDNCVGGQQVLIKSCVSSAFANDSFEDNYIDSSETSITSTDYFFKKFVCKISHLFDSAEYLSCIDQ